LLAAVNILKVGLIVVCPEMTGSGRNVLVDKIVAFDSDNPPPPVIVSVSAPCCGVRVLDVGDIAVGVETVTLDVCTPKVEEIPDCVCGVTVVVEGSMISDTGIIGEVSTLEPIIGDKILEIGVITRLEIVGITKVSAAETTPINDIHITHIMRKAVLLISFVTYS